METEILSPKQKHTNKVDGALRLLHDMEKQRLRRRRSTSVLPGIKLEGMTHQREEELINAVWNFARGVLTYHPHSSESLDAFAAYYSYNGQTHDDIGVLRRLTEVIQQQSTQDSFDYFAAHAIAEKRFTNMLGRLVDHAIVPVLDTDTYHLQNARRIVEFYSAK